MPILETKPFVFVLMPFDPKFDDVYELGIKPACKKAGARCQRVDKQIFLESILERVYGQIRKADLIVAEMTGRNPNVFYEVGYAHALKKRVILATRNAKDIPFDLKPYPHIVYGGKIAGLRAKLEKQIKALLEQPQDSIKETNKYGITITSHTNQMRVPEVPINFPMTGRFEIPFPEGSFHVLSRHQDEYWPIMRKCTITKDDWRADVEIGGVPGPRLIVVAIIGEEMQALCKNYYEVGDKAKEWKSIKAPRQDVIECARVVVNRI